MVNPRFSMNPGLTDGAPQAMAAPTVKVASSSDSRAARSRSIGPCGMLMTESSGAGRNPISGGAGTVMTEPAGTVHGQRRPA